MPIAKLPNLSYNLPMMSRILTIIVVLGFSGAMSSAQAEQVEMAKHCEVNCGCIPCGCAGVSCDREKEDVSSFTQEAPVVPVGDAVKAE